MNEISEVVKLILTTSFGSHDFSHCVRMWFIFEICDPLLFLRSRQVKFDDFVSVNVPYHHPRWASI